MLIDTHSHITDKKFDYRQIIADMDKDNLSRIITVGYDYKNSLEGLEIAKNNENVYCSLGLHPSSANFFDDKLSQQHLELSNHPKVVAIGEIGLDYHYPDFDKAIHVKACVAQLEIAHRANLPVIIHMRDCDADMKNLLKANKSKLTKGGVMHCYSGSLESAYEYMDLGFYISFTGVITYKNAKKASEIIENIPPDKILIETDCPYLSPEPYRGQLNFPKNVVFVAKHIAEVLDKSLKEVAQITTDNAYRLFDKLK